MRFTSSLHLALIPHQKDSLAWEPPALDIDVVTHFAPNRRCIQSQYEGTFLPE
jgi:hypothetical protein